MSTFCFCLHCACELAKTNIFASQFKKKSWFDKRAKPCAFSPGDQVLVLSPIPGSTPHTNTDGLLSYIEEENDIAGPSGTVVQGRLKTLKCLLSYISVFRIWMTIKVRKWSI